ncbi:(+)-neomenthol dehydrogenase-like isoform X1 [Mercurialis annua]|uniref:(+)-neomenthol dehydrogenase-like isoform X1 n=1 Tax=Mercurialis annua TaxID=3986 RepID=UPI0021600449|nr:(+)-neomenthol dehydrogenase-like isoform X1 [Mercurialis annua]
MAQSTTITTPKRYAVVTGGNKGIGFEICRQLACHGIVVILTARDKNRGLEAVEKLKQSGISDDLLIFHQLDVVDSQSIACLADFIKTQFGKLDILVNNAGIGGIEIDSNNFRAGVELNGGNWPDGKRMTWDKMLTQSFDSGEQCVKTNYYGAKATVEALAPLLQLSDSARIVNVASLAGLLENIPNEWAKGILSDVERLTEERVDEVVKQFLKDFKDDLLETKGWPTHLSAYMVAKAAMIAYTRVLAIKYPSFLVNALCPGFCKTDITINNGPLTAAEGAESVVRLALLPNGGPSGLFYYRKEISSF